MQPFPPTPLKVPWLFARQLEVRTKRRIKSNLPAESRQLSVRRRDNVRSLVACPRCNPLHRSGTVVLSTSMPFVLDGGGRNQRLGGNGFLPPRSRGNLKKREGTRPGCWKASWKCLRTFASSVIDFKHRETFRAGKLRRVLGSFPPCFHCTWKYARLYANAWRPMDFADCLGNCRAGRCLEDRSELSGHRTVQQAR